MLQHFAARFSKPYKYGWAREVHAGEEGDCRAFRAIPGGLTDGCWEKMDQVAGEITKIIVTEIFCCLTVGEGSYCLVTTVHMHCA